MKFQTSGEPLVYINFSTVRVNLFETGFHHSELFVILFGNTFASRKLLLFKHILISDTEIMFVLLTTSVWMFFFWIWLFDTVGCKWLLTSWSLNCNAGPCLQSLVSAALPKPDCSLFCEVDYLSQTKVKPLSRFSLCIQMATLRETVSSNVYVISS